MSALRFFSIVLGALHFLVISSHIMAQGNEHTIVTDLTISFSPTNSPFTCATDSKRWHRIKKDLLLHKARQSAWLHIAQAVEKELSANDLVVTEIKVRELSPGGPSDTSWESRPGGIWVLRSNYTASSHLAVSDVDVLFGIDAVDPRPQWTLMGTPLQLNFQPEVPTARLTVRHGRPKPRSNDPRAALRVRDDGIFKIVQISDTHMVTGVGVCKDGSDAGGQPLPDSEADPLTVDFLGRVLDAEKPDLVILTGDQLHHDISDSQSTLFKVVAPLIERSIPYAVVFGNHDDEGTYALSRAAQMSLYQGLPFSLCQSGPEQVDGVGNYYLQVYNHTASQPPLLTLYLLDSHGQTPSIIHDPDYDPIKQSQIDWFTATSKALRKAREKDHNCSSPHVSLAFQHIPLPEYGDSNLVIKGGHRREPTEGPSVNTHFYHALASEGVAAVGCGHDHVNDFCGLLPQKWQQDGNNTSQLGPWLCYAGGSGFGGYCSYGDERYHRRTRVWEFDARTWAIKTWKHVEYAKDRIDKLVLVESGHVVAPSANSDTGTDEVVDQAVL